MKLWAGKLIMPPCMAELVNTKLSLRLILPWGRKASQIPYLFFFALGAEAFWFLPVWENLRKLLEALQRCSGFWFSNGLSDRSQSVPPAQLWCHNGTKLRFRVRRTDSNLGAATHWCDAARLTRAFGTGKKIACPSKVALMMCHLKAKPASLFTGPETETQPAV